MRVQGFQKLIEHWEQLSQKFNERVLRERALMLVSVVAIFYLVWDFLIAQPMDNKRLALEERFNAAQSSLDNILLEEQVLVKTLSNDPTILKRRQLLILEDKLKALDKELQALSVGLLPAEELPTVLYDVLEKSSSLKLLGVIKKPAEELLFENLEAQENQAPIENKQEVVIDVEGAPVAETTNTVRNAGVYRHSVAVAIEGRYFQIRDYLKQLEELPWRIYWDTLDYQVTKYPKAKVTLEVYTLSTERGFIGE